LPQRGASLYPNFANITYGLRDGTVLGGTTSTMYNTLVTTMGPGCGFQYRAIGPNDIGTSFTTPYVAAAAWIKSLVDNVAPLAMRKELVGATLPVPSPRAIDTEGGGIFDSPKLLSQTPYLVNLDGVFQPIQMGTLLLEYRVPAAGSNATVPFRAGQGISIAFLMRGGKLIARIRQPRPPVPPLPLTDTFEWEVVHAKLDITLSDGITRTLNEQSLGTTVTSITF